jgi:hypothetical protein
MTDREDGTSEDSPCAASSSGVPVRAVYPPSGSPCKGVSAPAGAQPDGSSLRSVRTLARHGAWRAMLSPSCSSFALIHWGASLRRSKKRTRAIVTHDACDPASFDVVLGGYGSCVKNGGTTEPP